jgi:hypothetical protein
MTNKRVSTIKVGGGADYAKVSERLKEFRQDNPNGLIETEPTFLDGQTMFKCRILKDKSNPDSAEATGHALGNKKGDKEFEKLESIATGRALALLGYASSGEIASSEEMEEFQAYQKEKKAEAIATAIARMNEANNADELKEAFFSDKTVLNEKKVVEAKDKRKADLDESN